MKIDRNKSIFYNKYLYVLRCCRFIVEGLLRHGTWPVRMTSGSGNTVTVLLQSYISHTAQLTLNARLSHNEVRLLSGQDKAIPIAVANEQTFTLQLSNSVCYREYRIWPDVDRMCARKKKLQENCNLQWDQPSTFSEEAWTNPFTYPFLTHRWAA